MTCEKRIGYSEERKFASIQQVIFFKCSGARIHKPLTNSADTHPLGHTVLQVCKACWQVSSFTDKNITILMKFNDHNIPGNLSFFTVFSCNVI